MKIVDSGVLPPSFMDFTIPSNFARSALYYVPQFGHFYCNSDYHIRRESLDLFLLIYVCSGTLMIETKGKHYSAGSDQIVLLDCLSPHQYYCTEDTDFLWFHFSGSSSAAYSNLLYEQSGVVFAGGQVPDLRRSFDRVLSYSQAVPNNEHMASMHIALILARLASPEKHTVFLHGLEPAIQYIRDHFGDSITLDELASMCSMSSSHFIRTFSKYLNRTPHEYLLAYRLQQSKRLLLTSEDSIEVIAELCGFNSASHFARAFRKSNGISPTEFRNMQF
ncbi:MAG: AraC family transcriptional regulator [Butyricicoccaceae bacterium]